jgi:hypothetical protein
MQPWPLMDLEKVLALWWRGTLVVFGTLRDAFSHGWLPDGSFAAVKAKPVASLDSYIDSLHVTSLEEDSEPDTPTSRREAEAASGVTSRGGHYRGVRQRLWGKFTAEILDPAKNGARVWLGTYDNAEDTTVVYDRTAYHMQGSSAILNFPLCIGSEIVATEAVATIAVGDKGACPEPANSDSSPSSSSSSGSPQRRKRGEVATTSMAMALISPAVAGWSVCHSCCRVEKICSALRRFPGPPNYRVGGRSLKNKGLFPGNRSRPKSHDRSINLQNHTISRPPLWLV